MDYDYAANAVLSVFSRNYMELKKGLPIRPSEMGVINILVHTPGPHTPAMLAQMLGVSKPMITAHLTSLLSKGYILRQASEEDGRVSYVLPTPKALELAQSAQREMKAHLTRLREGLGEEGFEQLLQLAQEANRILEEERDAPTESAAR